eukprot:SM000234S07895  [mRNA]  locus=s234:132798:135648:+ [translate_table: standard]
MTAMAVAGHGKMAAVIGAGIAGLACAKSLADNGILVSIFDLGRRPGGRMSRRRETLEDGQELFFDHGCQYFNAKTPVVQSFLDKFIADGTVAEWKGCFGTLDAASNVFSKDEDGGKVRLVCQPGMDAMCQALAQSAGSQTRFGTQVSTLTWANKGWQLSANNGEQLGVYDSVVLAAAYKTFSIDAPAIPKVTNAIRNVEAAPSFALMLAFAEPLFQVPFDGALVSNSERISWVARDSSKPGRQRFPECWVVHSTAEYAVAAMRRAPPPGRPSLELLQEIAQEMYSSFQAAVPHNFQPVIMKAHRWGGGFPTNAAAPESMCLVDDSHCLVACGDYCISPRVESAILSGLAAADKLANVLLSESRL